MINELFESQQFSIKRYGFGDHIYPGSAIKAGQETIYAKIYTGELDSRNNLFAEKERAVKQYIAMPSIVEVKEDKILSPQEKPIMRYAYIATLGKQCK